jgi:AraC-like DNA-binding protein
MKHFKSLSSYLEYLELPKSEHPLISVLSESGDTFLPCSRKSSPPISSDCYSISLKKIVRGSLNYGRTKYDFSNGALIFIAPRQSLQWDERLSFQQQGFNITFHEDFIRGTVVAKQIAKCGFFSYSANEALHLSPSEEEHLERIVEQIKVEYQNNHDAFSKEIILSHLLTLLKYAERFYARQFIQRESLTSDLYESFVGLLEDDFREGILREEGIPTIHTLAERLNVSKRYLSDALKKQTGKTANEHVQLFLVHKSKDILLSPAKSVSEVAYELGFEYAPYFSRLFKKRTGMSPTEYRNQTTVN